MTKNKKSDDFLATNSSAMFAIMKPYIAGAKVQLERYTEAQAILKTQQTVFSGMDRCTYELSALLEHLDSIESLLRSRGIKLPTGEKVRHFRNHLRHDSRGEADHSKGKRGEAIKLNENLLVQIEFTDNGVKMGDTGLATQEIDLYITMAESIMWAMNFGADMEIDGGEVKVGYREPSITIKSDSKVNEDAK